MSRMVGGASKFGSSGNVGPPSGIASSSNGSTNSPQASKGKMTWEAKQSSKFQSNGQAFSEFLKGLGHQPTRNQGAEDLEYVFQDPKLANFARTLMANLKPHNYLTSEEIESYEKLKEQGQALYGSDLEEAVSRRHAINEMHSHEGFKRLAKKERLEKELGLREGELKRLTQLEEAFKHQLLDWEVRITQDSQKAQELQNLIREKEMEIDIDIKLLEERMAEMNKFVGHLKNMIQGNEPMSICQIEGRRLIANEERLFNLIQGLIEKYGTSLIIKDAGYGDEGGTLSVENMQQVFAEYEAEFTRLKHCIIYEKVKQLRLEIDFEGQQKGVRAKFQDSYDKTVEWSEMDCDEASEFQYESMEALRKREVAFKKEYKALLKCARQTALTAVDGAFAGMTNIQTRSKRKLREFFMGAATALKAQRVRISITRNLVKAEAQLYGRLLRNIEENLAVCSKYSKKLEKPESIKTSDLKEKGKMLHSLMGHLQVSNPMDAITSVPKALTFKKRVSSEIQNQYWDTVEQQQSQAQDRYKYLKKVQDVMSSDIKSKSSSDTSKGGCEMRITELEKNIKKQGECLKTLQQTSGSLSNDLEKQAEENRRKCEEILRLSTTNI